MSDQNGRPVTPCGFISDGYTLDFEIPERHGVSVRLAGQRRPMTNRDLSVFLDTINPKSARYATPSPLKGETANDWLERVIDTARSEGIAKRLVSWSLTDFNGHPVPITAANVSAIYPPVLLANLLDVICGEYRPPSKELDVCKIIQDDNLSLGDQLAAIEVVLRRDETSAYSQANDLKN